MSLSSSSSNVVGAPRSREALANIGDTRQEAAESAENRQAPPSTQQGCQVARIAAPALPDKSRRERRRRMDF